MRGERASAARVRCRCAADDGGDLLVVEGGGPPEGKSFVDIDGVQWYPDELADAHVRYLAARAESVDGVDGRCPAFC